MFYYLCVVTLQYISPLLMCLFFTLMYKTMGESNILLNNSLVGFQMRYNSLPLNRPWQDSDVWNTVSYLDHSWTCFYDVFLKVDKTLQSVKQNPSPYFMWSKSRRNETTRLHITMKIETHRQPLMPLLYNLQEIWTIDSPKSTKIKRNIQFVYFTFHNIITVTMFSQVLLLPMLTLFIKLTLSLTLYMTKKSYKLQNEK